jgi:hypothetical protein
MSRDAERDDVLEWTLADAPSPDETPPADWAAPPESGLPSTAAHEAHHARRFSRWTWLILGGLILLSISAIAGYAAWTKWRAEDALRRVVLAEETAALAGDVNTLRQLIAPGYADWTAAQLVLAQHGQAAPVPLPWLKPPTQRGTITAIKQFGSDIMLVTVAREFSGADGRPITFTLPQFYQYHDGWKRVPPSFYDDEQKELSDDRLTVMYAASDADLITTIFPALNDTLNRACVAWVCPDGFAVTMSFLDNPFPPEVFTDTLPGPRLFAVLAPFNTGWLDQDQLRLPAPYRAGAPTDAAGVAEYRQMATQTLLAYTAQQLYRHAPNTDTAERNAFVFALAARLSVRLGLEAPEALNITALAAPLNAMDALWNADHFGVWDEPTQRQTALRAALILMDAVLAGEPVETEHRLFQQLPQRGALMEWLTQGIGLSVPELFHRFRAASEKNNRVDVQFETQAFMALNCPSQPRLWEQGENIARPFLSGVFPIVGVLNDNLIGYAPWSPDGRRLALFVGELAVVDMQTNALTWLPDTGGVIPVIPAAWFSDTLLAYIAYSGFTETDMHAELHLFDFANPERQFPVVMDMTGYALSPQRDWAAVVQPNPDGGPNGRITLQPALGGEPMAVLTGASPVWSPNGESLMYVEYQSGGGFLLKRADLKPQPQQYVVVAGDTLWGIAEHFGVALTALINLNDLSSDAIQVGETLAIPVAAQANAPITARAVLSSSELALASDQDQVALAWSLDGRTFALGITNGQSMRRASVWLINPDGSNRRDLLEDPLASIANLAFSADGHYLAISYYDAQAQQFKVYSAVTGEAVFTMPTTGSFAWSPMGHQLAVRSGDSIRILNSPVSGFAAATLKAEGCTEMWWRPRK